jgi:peptidoglycan/LPS O-acetylase OafA/YrhL
VFMLLGTLETGWLICFIVGTAIPQFAELSNPWLERAAHLVARYSYGLYLTHYACLWLAFTKFGFFHRVAQWAIFTVAVTLCPILLYHFFELPLIRVGRKLAEGRLASSRMEALAGRAA